MANRLTRAALLLAALALLLPASGAAGESFVERYQRFKLYADCLPMRLLVEGLHDGASKIGLTKEALQAAAESRLRSARLYRSTLAHPYHYLYVNVNVFGRAFSIRLEFNKQVRDILSGDTSGAATWKVGSVGTHGGNANYIVSSVSQHMDEFLVEFLRVNEKACEKRLAPPRARPPEEELPWLKRPSPDDPPRQ